MPFFLIDIDQAHNLLFRIRMKALLKISNVWAIMLCLHALYAGNSFASAQEPLATQVSETVPSQIERELLELINQARRTPLDTVSRLGLNSDAVLAGLPELSEILTDGIPPLNFNGHLYTSAKAHTEDMIANGYYSEMSIDGRSVFDRVAQSGYSHSDAGESLGMLAFTNFVPPDTAARLIFENIFIDEVAIENGKSKNILNPKFQDVGIYFGSGSWVLNGKKVNVYLATLDFGKEGMNYSEQLFVSLINQARSNPIKTAACLGMDMEKLFENRLDLFTILAYGLPPVVFDARLHKAAENHALDMFEKDYVSTVSLDGKTPEDRLGDRNYGYILSAEFIDCISSENYENPEKTVSLLFEKRFKEELSYDSIEKLVILNPDFNEIGVSLNAFENAGRQNFSGKVVNLLVSDLARTEDDNKACIFGIAYVDENRNENFDPGEGICGSKIEICDVGDGIPIAVAYSEKSGCFSAEVETGGVYMLKSEFEGRPYEEVLHILGEEPAFVEIRFESGGDSVPENR